MKKSFCDKAQVVHGLATTLCCFLFAFGGYTGRGDAAVVTIAQPKNGATVAGATNVSVQVASNVQWVNLYVDGKYWMSLPPLNVSWDSTQVSDGRHTIIARAYGSNRRILGTSSVTLKISNALAPARSPAATPGFLTPDSSQRLYSGTSYIVLAQALGASSATIENQSSVSLNCAFDNTTGLVSCTYVPSFAGFLQLKLTATFSDGSKRTASRQLSVYTPVGIYPKGDRFMYGFYSVNNSDLGAIQAMKYPNVTQRYCSDCTVAQDLAYVDTAAGAGMRALGYLDFGQTKSASQSTCITNIAFCQGAIDTMAQNSNLLLWGLPEEMRYSLPSEMNAVSTLSTYIHAHDPARRPVMMYMDSSYNAADIQNYVPYLDILGAGAYATANGKPRAWVRWRSEAEVQAISDAGFDTDQKTPILVSEGYCSSSCPTGSSIMHDTFTGLAAGLKGILVYGWEQVNSAGSDAVAGLTNSVNLIVGEDAIGEWVLKGQNRGDLRVVITSGPATTPSFVPRNSLSMSYPSVRAATFDWAGVRLIIAVNSSPQPVTAVFSGLPTGTPEARVVNEGRRIAINNDMLTDSFNGLEVHIYKVPLVTRGTGGSWTMIH
jgi:hypothetical protein